MTFSFVEFGWFEISEFVNSAVSIISMT